MRRVTVSALCIAVVAVVGLLSSVYAGGGRVGSRPVLSRERPSAQRVLRESRVRVKRVVLVAAPLKSAGTPRTVLRPLTTLVEPVRRNLQRGSPIRETIVRVRRAVRLPEQSARARVRPLVPSLISLSRVTSHLLRERSASHRVPLVNRSIDSQQAQPHARRVRSAPPPFVRILIPRLGVDASIFSGGIADGQPTIVDGYALTHFPFSAQPGDPGNDVIYGHDDIQGSIFRLLITMRVGDNVYITKGSHRFTYTVTGRSIVLPTDVAVMNNTQDATLTMISCTPLYVDTRRIVVRAALQRVS